MKRGWILVVIMMLFCGCSTENTALQRAMELRNKLQSSASCNFTVDITADYGEKIYTFSMHCQWDSAGDMRFTVTSPETITGITGVISDKGGNLTFDDKLLAFELLADGQVSPVSAPWLLLRALSSGYISSCTELEDGLQIHIDDSYEEDSLRLDIRTDQLGNPIRADIMWQGRRVVTLDIRDFTIV